MKKQNLSKSALVLLPFILLGCRAGTGITPTVSLSSIPTASVDSGAGNSSESSISGKASVSSGSETGKNDSPRESRAETILAGMSLEEKIAQMTIVAFDVWNEEVEQCFLDTKPGGFILFSKNITTENELKKLTSVLSLNSKDAGVPAFISVDQEGGAVQRVKFSGDYPKAADIGASGDTGLSYNNGFAIGSELAGLGFNLDFAPVMDVNSNPKNPVIGNRSFSNDPEVVSKMGTAMMQGLSDAGIIPCLKHFPGHGDTDTDSHTGLPKVEKTLDDLRKTELVPFKAGIDAGADLIMTAHIEFPLIVTETKRLASGEEIALPATLSKEILTDLLRTELGFEGVIITDSLEMNAISSDFGTAEATGYAICAGADIMLIPTRITGSARIKEYKQYIADVASLVKSGAIPSERIDESVLRIIKLKEKYGFFE